MTALFATAAFFLLAHPMERKWIPGKIVVDGKKTPEQPFCCGETLLGLVAVWDGLGSELRWKALGLPWEPMSSAREQQGQGRSGTRLGCARILPSKARHPFLSYPQKK